MSKLRLLSARARWRWPAVVGGCFALLALADRVAVEPTAPTLGWLWSFGAGAGAGLLLGGASGALARALCRKRTAVAIAPWATLGALGALHLARELGIFARLDGAYQNLALLSLGACFGLVLYGVALGYLLQPRSGHDEGWVFQRSLRTRWALGAALVATAAGLAVLDRTVETSAYPAAHDALRWTGLSSFVAAVWILGGQRLPRSELANGGLLLSLLFTSTLTREHERELATLESAPFSSLALRSIQAVVDFDLDGYAPMFGGGDCAAFDASVNPGRREIPGNGIDDNCRLGDAAVRRDAQASVELPTTEAPRSVLLITIDTLAARRMSLYGAKRKTTPELDAWARDAVVFERAYSSGGWTSLAISSLFRGLYPRRLRWTRLLETNRFSLLRVSEPLPAGEEMKTSFGMPIEDPRQPLAFWLERRGMLTAAVVNDRQSEFLDPRFVGRGFERFVDLDVGGRADDAAVTDAAIAALRELPVDRKWFFWVHYFGPHKPDERHRGIPDFGKSRAARYDHEIAYADREVRRLLAAVESDPRHGELAIFISADHGEQLRGDWRGHGGDVKDASIRIPILMKVPGVQAGRVDTPVSLVDLFPTILSVTETPGPSTDGVDLQRIARGERPNRLLYSETWRFNATGRIVNDRLAAFDGRFKLERDNLRDVATLYRQGNRERRVDEERHRKTTRRLQRGLDGYLEENGAIDMND